MKTTLLMLTLLLSANAAAKAEVQKLPAMSRAELEASRRQANFQIGFEYVLPQLIVGGEWTTTLKLINRGTFSIPPSKMFFFDSTGDFMPVTFHTTGGEEVTDTGLTFQLGPDAGVLEITFTGTDEARFGHAQIDPGACPLEENCTLYGEATLKNSHPSRPDFESVFPIETPSDLQFMLWDHRDGFTTALYLVNANLSTSTVELEFRDADDAIIDTVTIEMSGAEAQILSLHALVPATIGKQGSLAIVGENTEDGLAEIVVTALRINPSNSFTPVRSFTSIKLF